MASRSKHNRGPIESTLFDTCSKALTSLIGTPIDFISMVLKAGTKTVRHGLMSTHNTVWGAIDSVGSAIRYFLSAIHTVAKRTVSLSHDLGSTILSDIKTVILNVAAFTSHAAIFGWDLVHEVGKGVAAGDDDKTDGSVLGTTGGAGSGTELKPPTSEPAKWPE